MHAISRFGYISDCIMAVPPHQESDDVLVVEEVGLGVIHNYQYFLETKTSRLGGGGGLSVC